MNKQDEFCPCCTNPPTHQTNAQSADRTFVMFIIFSISQTMTLVSMLPVAENGEAKIGITT